MKSLSSKIMKVQDTMTEDLSNGLIGLKKELIGQKPTGKTKR